MAGEPVCVSYRQVPSTASPVEKSPAPVIAKVSQPQPEKAQAQNSVTHLMLGQLKADVYEMRQVFLAAVEASTQHQQRARPETRQTPRGCTAYQQAHRGDHRVFLTQV